MKYELTPAELDALAAWWEAGTVVGAAKTLGRSVQTVKNQLADARRRSQTDSNLAALKANWKAVGSRHPQLIRRLRYQIDPAYRDRVRNQSRDAMRRMRTKRAA